MSHVVRFQVPLTCTNCGLDNDAHAGLLYTSSFGQDPIDTNIAPGEVVELDVMDFEDGYFTLRRPGDGESRIIAIEMWGCGHCGRVQAARLVFERMDASRMRFVGASVAPLSSTSLDEASFISRRLREWTPGPGDDVDLVRELQRRLG